jgi:hypothetical protein
MIRPALSFSIIVAAAFTLVNRSVPPAPPEQPIDFNHKAHLDYFQDGRHRRAMISLHEDALMKELGDKDAVADLVKQVEQGGCGCHRDFNENVTTQAGLVRLGRCGNCHRAFADHDWEGRKDQRPCMGCHDAAGSGPLASLPGTDTCAACHEKPLSDSLEEQRLQAYLRENKPLEWTRIHDYLPGEIVFSHERHVELGRVRCQECHGPVELAEHPLSLQVQLSMEDCMDCHESWEAGNDCLACHR